MYNIYIINRGTLKAEALIGVNLNERQAERRAMTGLMRINENYFVADVLIGSDEDKQYSKDIKK